MDVKSFDVFETTATPLKPGKFKSALDGKEYELSPDLMKKLFDNLSGSIPIYLEHYGFAQPGVSRTIRGFVPKWSFESDELTFTSQVYDQQAQKAIILDGVTESSVEVDYDLDENGVPIDGRILGVALTIKGAIPDSQISVVPVAFSGESIMNNQTQPPAAQDPPTGSQAPNLTVNFPPDMFNKGDNPEMMEVSKHNEIIEAKDAEIAQWKKQHDDVVKKYEGVRIEQVKTLSAELVKLGVANPDAIVEGLPVDQQMDVLGRMKANIVITEPGTTPGTSAPPAGQQQNADQQRAEAIKQLGLSEEFVKGDKR